jgi:hypothetical protein
MNNPGVYTASAAVTTAGTQVTSSIPSLDGMLAASISLAFSYGSGGTTCDAFVQTSLDGGTVWQDVAHGAFTTASAVRQFNVSGLTPKLTPSTPGDGTLAADTAADGVLGPTWRMKVVSVGTYGGSTQIVARIVAR